MRVRVCVCVCVRACVCVSIMSICLQYLTLYIQSQLRIHSQLRGMSTIKEFSLVDACLFADKMMPILIIINSYTVLCLAIMLYATVGASAHSLFCTYIRVSE